jgi:serine/threonine protein kinase/Tol biopolymer transport system component
MTPEMTADRWQDIDRLFHSTLECAPEKRASFLSQACGDDHDLRTEVESLLRAHEQDGSFLDLPAYEVAADFLADAFGGLLAGQQIGPYKIISPLATGGMGEVYLAQDTRLGRKIALKLLPPDFAKDQHRVRRFAQEARAASTLNHPNVCVIHEVGKTSDGRHFIAMELIEGITLRERIMQGRLSLADAMTLAEQIAAALVAAHAAGVIHRDIKPENIMLRTDGYVKVLDFGLAKLSESQPGRININEASTIAHVHTEPGTQMGTVRYMSPEHLRERPVDERADIWSFGVVLHEMITGVTPFEARTRNEIIALILRRQPARLRFSDDVPPEFQQLVAKALNKNREQRYQTVSALAADLKKFRRQFLGETSAEPLSMPDQNAAARQRIITKASESATRHKRKVETHASSDAWKSALTYISQTAEQVLTGIKGHPKTTVFAGLIAVFALFIVAPRIPWSRSQPQTVAPFQTIKMTPLTNAGRSVCAAISPDGKLFAHAEKKDGMQELLTTNVANSGFSVVVPAGDYVYRGITFSHDGNYLYFTRSVGNSDVGALYQVALPGGSPRKLLDSVDSPISFSPTGDRFAFVQWNRAIGEYSLMIANVDGTGARAIATRRDGKTFSIFGAAWSPDEKSIVCGAGWWDHLIHMNLVEVAVDNGKETPVGGQQWYFVLQVAWLEDKSALIVSAKDQPLSPYQLWRVSYPQGKAEKITRDVTEYQSVSLSQDANAIVSVQSRFVGTISVGPGGDVQRFREIKSSVGRVYGLDWTSKGRIFFSSMVGNNMNISSINPDGSDQTALNVSAQDDYSPASSPDGRLVVFSSNRAGSLNIWRMNASDGGDLKQLTFSDGNAHPTCSADGQWVLYENQSGPTMSVWRVSIDGGDPVKIIDNNAWMPVVSPDNQFIACRYDVEAGQQGIAILPFQGGPPVKLLRIPIRERQRIQWSADSRSLTYVDTVNGVYNIWTYEIASDSRKQVTHFKSDQILAYAWSPDHKQLASDRGAELRDVMIISPER